ncbi:hypothetical protein THOM_2477 [Trachipleistophora hominis]|uniref:Uncharacterized protein n=1 Tax=Trachipleistophora hominis TaxID=72359 RepID=L7JT06_TRAHO|nr:hypothetical protein THOM_2477 [Trachipleistophora hominis]
MALGTNLTKSFKTYLCVAEVFFDRRNNVGMRGVNFCTDEGRVQLLHDSKRYFAALFGVMVCVSLLINRVVEC